MNKIVNINPLSEKRQEAIKEVIADLQAGQIKEYCFIYCREDEPYLRYYWDNMPELIGYLTAIIQGELAPGIWEYEE